MYIKNIEFEPWISLHLERTKRLQDNRFNRILTAKDLGAKLRLMRHNYLGSGFAVDSLVRVNGKPLEDAVEELSSYLAQVTYTFINNEYRRSRNSDWCKDWCDGFYYYTTMLFAHGMPGKVDDYIQLAEAYEKCANTIYIVFTENLPDELAEEAGKWVMENEAAPLFLTDCVTAAVAVLMGAMPEPKMEEKQDE